MPLEPYSDSFTLTQQPPATVSDSSIQWLTDDDYPRAFTTNTGNRVVVCLPTFSLPVIERGAPQFSTLTARTTTDTTADLTTLFETAQLLLDPTLEPQTFFYAVRFGSRQIYGNTPGRFLEDLEDLERRLEHSSVDTIHSKIADASIVGAGCWPTDYGWLAFEVTRSTQGSFTVELSLLTTGALLDPTPVFEFFETCSLDPPRTHTSWPLRHLRCRGHAETRIHPIEPITTELDSDPEYGTTLSYHGANPLFDFDLASVAPSCSEAARSEIVAPLSAVATLCYETDTTGTDSYRLDRLLAVEPPGARTLFVSATVRPVDAPIA
ncbi:hypothetical protein [Halapricum salinum]|uniref:Uncharacterized protein n=1 Tax=Halapricum salinum TaxID=1457250 RepID=A0A4D6HC75_9EURY|nr:hypothetical protein [Halapricum salinum]QCC51400.1 hypothetical protein DV733_09160 [Halapricum salinum]